MDVDPHLPGRGAYFIAERLEGIFLRGLSARSIVAHVIQIVFCHDPGLGHRSAGGCVLDRSPQVSLVPRRATALDGAGPLIERGGENRRAVLQ